jgi:hypothetical protein
VTCDSCRSDSKLDGSAWQPRWSWQACCKLTGRCAPAAAAVNILQEVKGLKASVSKLEGAARQLDAQLADKMALIRQLQVRPCVAGGGAVCQLHGWRCPARLAVTLLCGERLPLLCRARRPTMRAWLPTTRSSRSRTRAKTCC